MQVVQKNWYGFLSWMGNMEGVVFKDCSRYDGVTTYDLVSSSSVLQLGPMTGGRLRCSSVAAPALTDAEGLMKNPAHADVCTKPL